MVAGARNPLPKCPPARRAAAHVCLSLAALLLAFSPIPGQEVRHESGLFLTVQNPITSDVVSRVVAKTDRALANGKVRKLIFDFNPGNHASNSEDYGACRDLAAHLLNLKQCQT